MLATPQASLTAANPVWRTVSISPVSNPPTSLTRLLGVTLPGNGEAPGGSLSSDWPLMFLLNVLERSDPLCCWLSSLATQRRLTEHRENSPETFPSGVKLAPLV